MGKAFKSQDICNGYQESRTHQEVNGSLTLCTLLRNQYTTPTHIPGCKDLSGYVDDDSASEILLAEREVFFKLPSLNSGRATVQYKLYKPRILAHAQLLITTANNNKEKDEII